MVVADATTCLCNVLHTALVGTLHIVAKGEEGIAAEAYACILGYPGLLLLTAEWFWLLCEELLPFAICQDIHIVVADIDIDCVVSVGTTNAWDEGQGHHLRVLTQPPDVCLVACQTGAVNAALLTCADTDGLTVFDVANAVALRIFEGNQGNDEVALGVGREVLVDGRNVLEECRVIQFHFVPALFECHAEHLFTLDRCRGVVRVNLYDVVSSLAFVSENLECFLCVAGCNDAVAHFALDDEGCCFVASVAQGNEVAVAAHAVGTASSGISTGDGAEGHLDVIHEIDAGQGLAQGQTYCSSGWGHVLEACCCGQTRSGFKLLDQLPAVQGVEEIDITGTASQHFDRKITFLHVNARRLLVGVTSVFELQFFLCHVLLLSLFYLRVQRYDI